tara:strand:+ start:1854 stop:2072 length:219 start_codon:yes stop_codon:yes gene_type:complete
MATKTKPKNETEVRAFCLSLSKRNKDILEILDEWSDELMLNKANTVCKIIREYPTLKRKAQLRELEAFGLRG